MGTARGAEHAANGDQRRLWQREGGWSANGETERAAQGGRVGLAAGASGARRGGTPRLRRAPPGSLPGSATYEGGFVSAVASFTRTRRTVTHDPGHRDVEGPVRPALPVSREKRLPLSRSAPASNRLPPYVRQPAPTTNPRPEHRPPALHSRGRPPQPGSRVSDGCLSHSARPAGRRDGWRGFFWAVRYDGTAGHPDYHRVETPNLQRQTALKWTVTIGYAKVLSRVVKRIPRLRQSPYQFRFFV